MRENEKRIDESVGTLKEVFRQEDVEAAKREAVRLSIGLILRRVWMVEEGGSLCCWSVEARSHPDDAALAG